MANDKCKRCGQCCTIKMDIFGMILQTQFQCEYLEFDEKEKKYRCSVYENRFEICPDCHPIEYAIKEGLVPETCGYVEGIDYKCKVKGKVNINPENE